MAPPAKKVVKAAPAGKAKAVAQKAVKMETKKKVCARGIAHGQCRWGRLVLPGHALSMQAPQVEVVSESEEEESEEPVVVAKKAPAPKGKASAGGDQLRIV